MDSETLTKLRAAAQDLPRGVAARIDAVDLVQLLDEREALFALADLIAHMGGAVDIDDVNTGCNLSLRQLARSAIAKAGAP